MGEARGGFKPGQTDASGCDSKKALKPARKRSLAEYLDGAYSVGMRRACRVVEIGGSTYYYRSVRDDRAVRKRIHEIAETRVRYGYKRIHVLLRREGRHVNYFSFISDKIDKL